MISHSNWFESFGGEQICNKKLEARSKIQSTYGALLYCYFKQGKHWKIEVFAYPSTSVHVYTKFYSQGFENIPDEYPFQLPHKSLPPSSRDVRTEGHSTVYPPTFLLKNKTQFGRLCLLH